MVCLKVPLLGPSYTRSTSPFSKVWFWEHLYHHDLRCSVKNASLIDPYHYGISQHPRTCVLIQHPRWSRYTLSTENQYSIDTLSPRQCSSFSWLKLPAMSWMYKRVVGMRGNRESFLEMDPSFSVKQESRLLSENESTVWEWKREATYREILSSVALKLGRHHEILPCIGEIFFSNLGIDVEKANWLIDPEVEFLPGYANENYVSSKWSYL